LAPAPKTTVMKEKNKDTNGVRKMIILKESGATVKKREADAKSERRSGGRYEGKVAGAKYFG